MDKLFEGIARVKFTEREEVYAMISAEQEEVPFDPKDNVDVNEGNKKGNVEVWMVEIEKVMIKTLRQKTRDSNKDYTKQSLEDWVGKWPGQVVLAVD
jgi:dynein heavy chain